RGIRGKRGVGRVTGGARRLAGRPPRPDGGLPGPRRQRTRRAAGRLLVAGLLRCLPRAANRTGAFTPRRPLTCQAATSVEVRRFRLDVARHFRVHDLTLAVRIERDAAVLAEFGLVELGPDAHLSDTDLAQYLANLLDGRRLVLLALGAEQRPDDTVRDLVAVANAH